MTRIPYSKDYLPIHSLAEKAVSRSSTNFQLPCLTFMIFTVWLLTASQPIMTMMKADMPIALTLYQVLF